MLRPSYNAYGDRHTTRTAVAILSPFPFNLKRDMFRAKNQYDKMEEKKLSGAKKTIYLNRRTRACGAKKECARMEELMFVDRKKIKLRLLEDNHGRTYIIQFFMFPERILP